MVMALAQLAYTSFVPENVLTPGINFAIVYVLVTATMREVFARMDDREKAQRWCCLTTVALLALSNFCDLLDLRSQGNTLQKSPR